MNAYLDHFGLRNESFSTEIDDDKLWLPESKRGIVDELVACVHEPRHACLTSARNSTTRFLPCPISGSSP